MVKFSTVQQMITKVLVVLALTAASSQAGVIYDFIGTGVPNGPEPVSFHLTVPDFLNPPLDAGFPTGWAFFSCAQLDSSTNCASGDPMAVGFSNQDFSIPSLSAFLTFRASNANEYMFYFPSGAFSTPGVYSALSGGNFNPGTLTVSPEPTAILWDLPVWLPPLTNQKLK